MDGFALNITIAEDSLFCPRFLEEEEEEEGLIDPDLLEEAEADLLNALREWVSKRKRRFEK